MAVPTGVNGGISVSLCNANSSSPAFGELLCTRSCTPAACLIVPCVPHCPQAHAWIPLTLCTPSPTPPRHVATGVWAVLRWVHQSHACRTLLCPSAQSPAHAVAQICDDSILAGAAPKCSGNPAFSNLQCTPINPACQGDCWGFATCAPGMRCCTPHLPCAVPCTQPSGQRGSGRRAESWLPVHCRHHMGHMQLNHRGPGQHLHLPIWRPAFHHLPYVCCTLVPWPRLAHTPTLTALPPPPACRDQAHQLLPTTQQWVLCRHVRHHIALAYVCSSATPPHALPADSTCCASRPNSYVPGGIIDSCQACSLASPGNAYTCTGCTQASGTQLLAT